MYGSRYEVGIPAANGNRGTGIAFPVLGNDAADPRLTHGKRQVRSPMSSRRKAYPDHVRAFSELLIRLRSALGNDLDKVLILSVIAERHYAATEALPAENDCPAEQAAARERYRINALSVAQYAGIPRETARRKIAALVGKGWVACDASGNLSPTPRAADDLAGGTAATLTYLRAITDAARSSSKD